jgi:acetoin utilization deacetylase AcuC-like enzyme
MPLFPGTGSPSEKGAHENVVNVALKAGDGGEKFRKAYESTILPALRKHQPDLILVSAGFDAHANDPLAGLKLVEADFAWITRQLLEVAHAVCGGRMVSMLEGGYDLDALGRSVAVHIKTLMEA